MNDSIVLLIEAATVLFLEVPRKIRTALDLFQFLFPNQWLASATVGLDKITAVNPLFLLLLLIKQLIMLQCLVLFVFIHVIFKQTWLVYKITRGQYIRIILVRRLFTDLLQNWVYAATLKIWLSELLNKT